MPRTKSAVLTPAEKRSALASARATAKEERGKMKGLRAEVTAAKKVLRTAESAFNKQQKVVDKAAAVVEQLKASSAAATAEKQAA